MTGRGKSAGSSRGRGRSAPKQRSVNLDQPNSPGRVSDANAMAPEQSTDKSHDTIADQFADDDPQVQGRQPEVRPEEGEWRPKVTIRAVSLVRVASYIPVV